MDAKTATLAYAKSKTVWGGILQWALSGVLAILASDKPHVIKLGLDENAPYLIPVTGPVLFAAASACLWLVLYGRSMAKGPLLSIASALPQISQGGKIEDFQGLAAQFVAMQSQTTGAKAPEQGAAS